MKNEPLAWKTVVDGKNYVTDDADFVIKMWKLNKWEITPLYTHPKNLTDQEITEAVAKGWCTDKNSMKKIDPDLAYAIVEEVKFLLRMENKK